MSKLKLLFASVLISSLFLLVITPTSAATSPWQINGNNVYYTDGKVGIGTRAPTEELDIVGDIKVRGPANQAGEGGRIHFTTFGRNNSGPKIKSSLVNADGANSQADLILSSYYGGDMDEITLKNGNVGIGTDAPESILHVNQATPAGWNVDRSSFRVTSPNPVYGLSLDSYVTATGGGVGYVFKSIKNGVKKNVLTMHTNGKVVVNGADPTGTFTVNETSTSKIELLNLDVGSFGNTANSSSSHFIRTKDLGNGRVSFIVKGNGRVGINKENPSHMLTVDGSVCLGNC